MTIIYQSGYTIGDGGHLLKEDNSFLLLESGGKILVDAPQPLTHARIIHSNLWLSGGTATASSTASGYLADGPLNSLTYERWKPATSNATWDYVQAVPAGANCVGIAAHTLGSTKSLIKVQHYDSGSWTDLIDWHAVPDNEPIIIFWDDVTDTRFRLAISYSTAPEVGVIKFANHLSMQAPIYGGHAPVDLAREAVLRSNYSETGDFLGRSVQRTYNPTSFSWQHLSADWIRTYWPSLQTGIEAEPFFIAWRPASFDAVGYMQTDKIPIPVNMGIRNLMEVELSGRGLGHD